MTLSVRTFAGRAYVPLSGLTLFEGSRARYLAASRSYQLYTPERTLLTLPLDLSALLGLKPGQEYPTVVRK